MTYNRFPSTGENEGTFFKYAGQKQGNVMLVVGAILSVSGSVLLLMGWGKEDGSLALWGLIPLVLGVATWSKAKKFRAKIIIDLPGLYNYVSESEQKLFLFLRPFASDETREHVHGRAWIGLLEPDEVIIEQRLMSYGIGIALGAPGEELPTMGFCRYYMTGDSWQATVSDLIEHSEVILMRWSDSDSMEWELSEVLRKKNLGAYCS